MLFLKKAGGERIMPKENTWRDRYTEMYLLEKDGIDTKLLSMLSVESKAGYSLKKTLRHFDRDMLINEACQIAEYYDGLEGVLDEVSADYRIKSTQSIVMKFDRHYPDAEAEKVFNDIIGFRLLCSSYEQILDAKEERFRTVNMANGKKNDDGYRGVHLYYQPSHRHYPVEFQFNTFFDRQCNDWLHIFVYKRNMGSSVGRLLRKMYESGEIRSSEEFKEALKNVLHNSERCF